MNQTMQCATQGTMIIALQPVIQTFIFAIKMVNIWNAFFYLLYIYLFI
jgi:hypothetical protein